MQKEGVCNSDGANNGRRVRSEGGGKESISTPRVVPSHFSAVVEPVAVSVASKYLINYPKIYKHRRSLLLDVMNTFIRQSGRHRQRNTDIYREIQY